MVTETSQIFANAYFYALVINYFLAQKYYFSKFL